jgi:hypothetical protein
MARNGGREIIRRTRASDLPGLNQADNPRDAASERFPGHSNHPFAGAGDRIVRSMKTKSNSPT